MVKPNDADNIMMTVTHINYTKIFLYKRTTYTQKYALIHTYMDTQYTSKTMKSTTTTTTIFTKNQITKIIYKLFK